MKKILLVLAVFQSSYVGASGYNCPETAEDLYEEIDSVVLLENLSVRVNSFEDFKEAIKDKNDSNDSGKYLKEWIEFDSQNISGSHLFVVKKSYKGKHKYGDMVSVNLRYPSIDFLLGANYILFLNSDGESLYSLNACLIVDVSSRSLYSLGAIADQNYFAVLVSALEGKKNGDERARYLSRLELSRVETRPLQK